MCVCVPVCAKLCHLTITWFSQYGSPIPPVIENQSKTGFYPEQDGDKLTATCFAVNGDACPVPMASGVFGSIGYIC